MSYYVKWVDDVLGGDWCVMKKRNYWFDKTCFKASVYVYGQHSAKVMADEVKEFYEKQDKP